MSKFNKVVLSRKGFDGSTGGGFSPFDPKTGKYILLPIPEREKDWQKSNPLQFEKIKIKNNYFEGWGAANLRELMERGNYWLPEIRGNKKEQREESEYAHFDPWLGPCPWLEGESNHQIGAFGQAGTAQSHLRKQRVGKGSLFLFYSRFRPFPRAQVSWQGFSPKHLNEGLYFIYGWLRVGEVFDKFEDIDSSKLLSEEEKTDLKERHPHGKRSYFEECKHKNNTIYIADKRLFDDSDDFCGSYYFPKLTCALLLTATDSEQGSNWISTRWKLPGFFYQPEHRPSYLKGPERDWQKADGDSCYVTIPGRGQEFVFDGSDDFDRWLSQ